MVAEANQESHGFGYNKDAVSGSPLFAKQIMERNQHNVGTKFNHPSVIFWSLGNETCYSKNFDDAYDWIKSQDQSRPVQYERAELNGYATDIFCPMYYSPKACEDYSKNAQYTRPLIHILQFLGMDGINYNFEDNGYSDNDVVKFHQSLYEYAKQQNFNDFHVVIYTGNATLTSGNSRALFAETNAKTSDLMLNYMGDDFSYNMGSSVREAKRVTGSTKGLYAGCLDCNNEQRMESS